MQGFVQGQKNEPKALENLKSRNLKFGFYLTDDSGH